MFSILTKLTGQYSLKIILFALLCVSVVGNKIQYDEIKMDDVHLQQHISRIGVLEVERSSLQAIIERKDDMCALSIAQAIDMVRRDKQFQCISERLIEEIDGIPAREILSKESPAGNSTGGLSNRSGERNDSKKESVDIDGSIPDPLIRLLEEAYNSTGD